MSWFLTTSKRLSTRDQGAAALIVALSLLMLMGFSALAIDAGLGFNDRRGTQNAADSAALAAAWEACNPEDPVPDPIQAGRDIAAENGYDHDAASTDVQVADLGSGQWQVHIRSTNATHFGAATPFEADSITVASSAVAECEEIPFLGGYAIFAGGPASCTGGVELDLSGASKIINGGMHSNGAIKVTGAEAEVNGDVTYVGSSEHTPSTQLYSPLDYPLDLTIEEYRPGGTRALEHDDPDPGQDRYFDTPNQINNSWMEDRGHAVSLGGQKIEITRSGVYYAGDNIDLHQVSMAPDVEATFVSEGKIKITGESAFRAFDPIVGGASDPGVLFFSNHEAPPAGPTCTGNAVEVSTSDVTWTGAIFAPHGAVKAGFSSATSLNGSIFAYTVNLSGSDFEISWHDNPTAEPDFAVGLLR